jgi:hypothetical protein
MNEITSGVIFWGLPSRMGQPSSITNASDPSLADVEVPSNAFNSPTIVYKSPDNLVHLIGPQCHSRAHSIRNSEANEDNGRERQSQPPISPPMVPSG